MRMACCGEPAERWPIWAGPFGPQALSANGQSADEKAHLYASELYHVVVRQAGGLGTDGIAIQQREVVVLATIDVHDEIAFSAARYRGDLDAWPPECRQRFAELELTACKRAREHL